MYFVYPEKYGDPTVGVNQEGELDEESGLYEIDSVWLNFDKAKGFFNVYADKEEEFKKEGEKYIGFDGEELAQDNVTKKPIFNRRDNQKGFRVINDNAILWYSQNPLEGTKDVVTTIYASINLSDSDYKGLRISFALESGQSKRDKLGNVLAPAKPTTQAEIEAALADMTRTLESFRQL